LNLKRRFFDLRLIALLAMVSLTTACSTTAGLDIAPLPTSTAPRYAAIVVDAQTREVLYSSRAEEPRYPASLTKMMTAYMLFNALKEGRVSLDTPIPVSRNAASKPPTKLYLRTGSTVDVETAIRALCTKSANDVATAVAEYLGGTEEQFAAMMTQQARQIGMRNTTFRNASGLPDPGQTTTARDMALLGMALRTHYPAQYRYFSLTEFEFNGKTINGHNDILKRVRGADGIKTGYTRASGYNLVSSVGADGRRIVAVVMGEDSARRRDDLMEMLIARFLPEAKRG
jgi:D-alanyl-D-alanine carboxypeptidase